jgi:hypothetical protein
MQLLEVGFAVVGRIGGDQRLGTAQRTVSSIVGTSVLRSEPEPCAKAATITWCALSTAATTV